ncbi:3D domain-containing protein [Dethiothermospora halolimnae]|uniref:3D domain-containing protein n=1 Tax=Dethiothermospora halolimnae TaxID=3114390 RepID=UPI003CCBABAE
MGKKKIIFFVIIIMVIGLGIYSHLFNEVKVIIDDEKVAFNTMASSAEELLIGNNINIGEGDYINVGLKDKLTDGMEIVIRRAVPVTVYNGNKKIETNSNHKDVKSLLEDLNIVIDDNDKVTPLLQDKIKKGLEIKVTKVDEIVENYKEEIPYRTLTKSNDSLALGDSKEIQKGKNGIKTIQVKKIYENGDLKEEVLVKENIKETPTNRIIEKGSKNYFVASRGGVTYRSYIDMTASAYDLSYQSTGKRPGDKYYGITASGTKVRPGVVAVDPKIIPLGTKIYIKSLDGTKDYGYAIAEDTGGAIKGKRIDLFMKNRKKALDFGLRRVRVYILE